MRSFTGSPRLLRLLRIPPGALLASAAALAVPAYLLAHQSFQPIEQRVHLEGGEATWDFHLASPESLFIEFEFTVRQPGGGKTGIVVSVNDTEVATVEVKQLYVTQRAMPLVPLNVVRTGLNRLSVKPDGAASATFEMNLRLHNYYGINPRFPRAFVVSDEALSQFVGQRSIGRHAIGFGMFYLSSLLFVWGITRAFRSAPGAGAYALALSPSVLLWCTLLYAFATPLHVWLSSEALLVLGLVPCLLIACVPWISAHLMVVARVAATAIVTIAVLEIALRFVNYLTPTAIFYTDSYSRFRGQPGGPLFDSRLNSLGFNDVDYQPLKSPGVYRIAAVGDSVAFGVVPYRANYLTLIEAELAPEQRIELINLGVPGTEPKEYLAILVEEGLAFDPDLVMVGFFIGNDFESAARKPREYSYVATFTYFLWRAWSAGTPALVGAAPIASRYEDDQPTLSWDRFLEIEVGRAQIYSKDASGLAMPMARAVGYLREMRAISNRAGANMLVVIIPDEAQVDQDLQGQIVRAHGSTSEAFDFRLPNRLLASELSKEGIPFLNLLPVFEQEGRRIRVYKPRDTHWNLAGNRLAATTIARFLREQAPGFRR